MKALFLKPPLEGQVKNVVRDFLYGCWCNGRRVGGMQMPPLNDLYATTHARAQGVDAVFLDAQFEGGRYEALLEGGLADVMAVVILSSTQSFQADAALLGRLKRINPAVKGILFGSHPTFMPRYCLSHEAVDYIVMREPEASLAELLLALGTGGGTRDILGIGFKDEDGAIRLNEPRPFMDMDDLPIPDRSLLPEGIDYFNPVVKRVPYTTIQTSRGCPGKCIFCTAPEFYGKKIRCRSTDNVMRELREIRRQGYREVFFRDETFTAYKKRNLEICRRMKEEGIDLSWVANGRVDMIDKETMVVMKDAGCHMLKFGVETGSQSILDTYRKGTTVEQARRVYADAAEVGLDTHAHCVLGGPGETEETLMKSIEFVKELNPTTASFGILTPYPGTKLFDDVAAVHPEIRDGSSSNMDNLHVQGFYSEAVSGMKGEELSKWTVRCYRAFYLRPSYLLKRLLSIRSLDELMAQLIAGSNILGFSLSGKK